MKYREKKNITLTVFSITLLFLVWACNNYHPSKGSIHSKLRACVINNEPEKLRQLIESGDNVNAQDYVTLNSILMEAIIQNNEKCINILIENSNLDLDIQNNDGYTALMWTAQYGYWNYARQLLEAGANPDIQDTSGQTALMIATGHGHKEILRLLIAKNADVHLKDNSHETAVEKAQQYDRMWNTELSEMFEN